MFIMIKNKAFPSSAIIKLIFFQSIDNRYSERKDDAAISMNSEQTRLNRH